jgi:hypothetical protein
MPVAWRIFLFIVALAVAGDVCAQSKRPSPRRGEGRQPQQSQTQTPQQPPAANQRGTEESPLIVRSVKSSDDAAQDTEDRKDKAANDRETIAINRNLVVIGFLQLAVFVGQLFVFGYQAWKLRQTVQAAVEQSRDMKASIAVAQRAAEAAELSAKAAIGVELPIISITDFALMEISAGRITGGVPPEVSELQLPFKNSGRTVASLIEQCIETIVVDALPTIPVYEHIYPFVPGTLVEAGKPSPVSIQNYFVRLTAVERDTIKDQTKSLWLYGYISFEDRLGERHESRFCARWVVYKVGVANTPTGFVYDSRTPPEYTRRT